MSTSTASSTPSRLTPLKAIRRYVLDHNHGDRRLVALGTPADVPPELRPYRFGKRPTAEDSAAYVAEHGEPVPTPCKAIKLRCLECSAGCKADVRKCHVTDCPLWAYRQGKNPGRRSGKPASQLAV